MIDRTRVDAWIEELRRGWSAGEPDAIGNLFTETVVYRASPFEEPLVGRDLVVSHWREELGGVDEAVVDFSLPLIDGDKVAVEWWAVVTRAGSATTDSGALVLGFAGGLCSRLHEYWMLRDSALEAPERYRILRGRASR
ncbi:MAG: nuclear transport factor 2 family protein [Acidimicrobiia bacterium]